ncbi:hypothetical protein MG7_05978 [Candida albicans P34048]|nr:hypothetical protein MG7_05978 [Candida albicans P34048]
MANPRAGSEAKARSMAMSVTIPEARASTSAHPQEAQGCWVQSIVLAVLRFTTGSMIGT